LLLLVVVKMMIMMMIMTMTTLLYLSGMGVRETRKRIHGSLPRLSNPHALKISVGKVSALNSNIIGNKLQIYTYYLSNEPF